MGGIGSGKSTYCRRFFRVVAPELVRRLARLWLFISTSLGTERTQRTSYLPVVIKFLAL